MRYLILPFVICLALSGCFSNQNGIVARTSKIASSEGEPFTLVVLPDTQCYCDVQFEQSAKKWGNGDLRQYFYDQVDWILESSRRLNTAFVVHEGDIVQSDYPEEWEIANEALSRLDGHVPYCLSLGNHDIGIVINPDGKGYKSGMNRQTRFDDYFPKPRFESEAWFGGAYDDTMANAYFRFNPSGVKLMVVSLEFHPRDEVLEWANQICQENLDYQVIILTHRYLSRDNTRISTGTNIEGNNGEAMWQKLVSQQANIFMVLCGHIAGEGYLLSEGVHGNQVHQILCDYQSRNNGGESWLRYMTFEPKDNKIEVFTYNPSLDTHEETPNSRFKIGYQMTSE
ncbi:metallophosphoesterase [Puniceicoccaceae bacterium K14]|nr:metallophosphoesterase [Puniceicoccaceae bacterium K14]